MADTAAALNALFAPSGSLEEDVLAELQSILRLHSISPKELFFKWEYYTMKMELDTTKVEVETVRACKKDMQETLERESRAKASKSSERKSHATPRGGGVGDDVFGMIDGLAPNTPLMHKSKQGSVKRKIALDTPPVPKFAKVDGMSSPTDERGGIQIPSSNAPFADRQNAGQVVETLNSHVPVFEPPIAPPAEPRVKLKANTDLKKFFYKPMAMHLSEASEILDERIDDFQQMVQDYHKLEDSAFGSACLQSTNEIVAVGRIACDTLEGKLNAASIMLETSRRTGAGLRVPLKVEAISKEFFPGQIVALRGINASGSFFSVKEVLDLRLPKILGSSPTELDAHAERAGLSPGETSGSHHALNMLIASGPYTADDNLAFEPLNALCEQAIETSVDVLILIGPILDIEHPLLASGDFDLPDDASIEPDKATLNDVFRLLIGAQLRLLAQRVPSITILMIPSVRDSVSKHVAWPQEPYEKKVLGLPKQAKLLTNPVMISLNEMLVAISASDVLYDLRREEVTVGKPTDNNLLSRLPRHLIQQRHFYPLFPPSERSSLPRTGTGNGVATGMPLDVSYLKLGEMLDVRPDLLITPSSLPPFGKVVDSVVVINPGTLSKRKGPGTYARLAIHPRNISGEEREGGDAIGHHLFDRTRADIVRI